MITLHKTFIAIVTVLLALSCRAELAQVTPGYAIELSRDGGSHPSFGTEWWYVTGWLETTDGQQRGFQITFFRSRNEAADINPSKFAPRQLLFAHAALSDAKHGKLLRAERSARSGFGIAEAREGRTDVVMDDWFLRDASDAYVTHIAGDDFSLSLTLKTTQPALLQGDRGFSRKGPGAKSASYYYSLPQLQVTGTVSTKDGETQTVRGNAWFDHEWSSEYLDNRATGWDWLGLNMQNGDAVMAFRIRDEAGQAYWSGGAWRSEDKAITLTNATIAFIALRRWRSPRTNVEYPVEWHVTLGDRPITLRPLMDDQENDARGSVGVLYWEGAVEAFDDQGVKIGRGYLELTGYGQRLRM